MLVLIVDDDPSIRRGMERLLSDAGHDPRTSPDGDDALAQMRESAPDVLVTDLILPGTTGLGLIAHARAAWPYLPIIVMTSREDVESVVAAMQAGADDYLVKPFDAEVLTLAIERSVERQRLLRERDQLRHQSDFSRAIARTLGDPCALRDAVVDETTRALGDGSVLHLLSEDGQHLEGVASHVAPALAPLLDELRTSRLDAAEVSRELRESGGPPVWDPWDRSDIPLRVSHSGFLISAPLRLADRVQGVLSVARSPTGRPFVAQDVALLGDLADRAALTLTNDRLLRDLQRELEQRRKAEESLRQTQEQLLHAQKMEAIGRLAGGIAHDFNNTLSIVLSYASLLADGMAPGDERRSDIEEISTAGRRAADLTRQLLAFSRRQVLQPAVVNLNDVVRAAERMLRRIIGENIQLVTSLVEDLRPAKLDAGQIEQVLMNLVVNARDAVGDRGRITIRTANLGVDPRAPEAGLRSRAYVALIVEDDGSGMDPATRARVFEPFFTTKPIGEGTGLGLSTVHGIVEQSGGFVRLWSELGAGSQFEVCFPVIEQAPERKAMASVRPRGGSETVLFVDDEEGVRKVAAAILKRHGYQVLIAATASDALRIVQDRSRRIDVLVTDVVMPAMSGSDLATAVVAARPEVRVLFMSGYPDATPPSLGAVTGFVQKPITPSSLGQKVREVLDS